MIVGVGDRVVGMRRVRVRVGNKVRVGESGSEWECVWE